MENIMKNSVGKEDKIVVLTKENKYNKLADELEAREKELDKLIHENMALKIAYEKMKAEKNRLKKQIVQIKYSISALHSEIDKAELIYSDERDEADDAFYNNEHPEFSFDELAKIYAEELEVKYQ